MNNFNEFKNIFDIQEVVREFILYVNIPSINGKIKAKILKTIKPNEEYCYS